VAEGKPEYALRGGGRAAVDTVLAAQAGLPSFEAWRQRPEAGGAGERPATTSDRSPGPRREGLARVTPADRVWHAQDAAPARAAAARG